MPDYEPEKAELASRDVVSRRMTEHIRTGFGAQVALTATICGWTSAIWARTTSSTICAR